MTYVLLTNRTLTTHHSLAKCSRNHGPARLNSLVLFATTRDGCHCKVGKSQILQREQPQRLSCDLQMSEGPCRSFTQGGHKEGIASTIPNPHPYTAVQASLSEAALAGSQGRQGTMRWTAPSIPTCRVHRPMECCTLLPVTPVSRPQRAAVCVHGSGIRSCFGSCVRKGQGGDRDRKVTLLMPCSNLSKIKSSRNTFRTS